MGFYPWLQVSWPKLVKAQTISRDPLPSWTSLWHEALDHQKIAPVCSFFLAFSCPASRIQGQIVRRSRALGPPPRKAVGVRAPPDPMRFVQRRQHLLPPDWKDFHRGYIRVAYKLAFSENRQDFMGPGPIWWPFVFLIWTAYWLYSLLRMSIRKCCGC